MESILHGNQPLIFKHVDISLIDDLTDHLISITSKGPSNAPFKAPFSTIDSKTEESSCPQSPCSLVGELPTIDDSSTFPETEPVLPAPDTNPYWLVDACFSHRIKLAHINDSNHIVQLLGRGSTPGMVQVRDHMAICNVATHLLAALPPRQKDDVVVVLSGEHIGKMFKVVEVFDTFSRVKKPGRVLRKNETHPMFPNDILVHAFGPLKN
ncbi:hypothetical protein BJ165DRAFT_1524804 [Panaeolus papilionaceus]|nr:hypothetical protein BJ165DRAFT_1524804 [Panaeolus papilionaceus]